MLHFTGRGLTNTVTSGAPPLREPGCCVWLKTPTKSFSYSNALQQTNEGNHSKPSSKVLNKTHGEDAVSCSSGTLGQFWGGECCNSIIKPKMLHLFATHLNNLSEGHNGAVGCDVRGGWGPERWEPLGGFPSDCKHVVTGDIPGKCY